MKHSWQDKLDEKGLELVEMARKLNKIGLPTGLNKQARDAWVKAQNEVLSSHPNLEIKRKVSLRPEFVRSLSRMHPDIELSEPEMIELFQTEKFGTLRADELELHQRIFLFLEGDPDRRFKAYAAVASAIALFKHLFWRPLKAQLGPKKLGTFNLFGFVARYFTWFADALRGRIRTPPVRENVDLATLCDAILLHQKEPLTQVELYEVAKAAGGEVPDDPEAFRLWLHRARRNGLVKNYRSTHSKNESDGIVVSG